MFTITVSEFQTFGRGHRLTTLQPGDLIFALYGYDLADSAIKCEFVLVVEVGSEAGLSTKLCLEADGCLHTSYSSSDMFCLTLSHSDSTQASPANVFDDLVVPYDSVPRQRK